MKCIFQKSEVIQMPDSDLQGRTVTDENGVQYFVLGKNRIKITEHFNPNGKALDELMTDLVIHKIKENAHKSA